MEFTDPIASGIFLVRDALRSPNYAAGASGWTVNQDGSAEFNNLTVRGTFSTGDVPDPFIKIFDTGPFAIEQLSSGDPAETLPGSLYAAEDHTGVGTSVFLNSMDLGFGHVTAKLKPGASAVDQPTFEIVNLPGTSPLKVLGKVFGDLFVSGNIYTEIGWTAVGFLNAWADFGGGYQTCQFRKLGNQVFLRGLMHNGAVGAVAFTLPAGYRPPAFHIFPGLGNVSAGDATGAASAGTAHTHPITTSDRSSSIFVDTNGQVTPSGHTTNSWVSLAGISFYTD